MKRGLKWAGLGLAGLLGLLLVVVGVAYGVGRAKTGATVSVSHGLEAPPPDSALLARGEHLASAVSRCASCHGDGLGGLPIIDDPAFGTIPAPNLTSGRGGVGVAHSPATWENAVRHGVGLDGRPLIAMPSEYFAAYSDADLRALVAYLEALPPADGALPRRSLGPLATVLVGTGTYTPPALALDHEAAHVEAPPEAATPEYGGYLVRIAACGECHGADLRGPDLPGPPPGPDLTPAGPLGSWTEDGFVSALRTGVTPDGRGLDAELMPWPAFAEMTDLELRAIWRYLEGLEAPTTGSADPS